MTAKLAPKAASNKTSVAAVGEPIPAPLTLQLRSGYHVNSNAPSDPYLIPLRLTWAPGALEVVSVVYPKPQMQTFSFSKTPLSIFSGNFDVVTRFKTAPAAVLGLSVMTGKLRYQACNDKMCLSPKTIDVTLPVAVVK